MKLLLELLRYRVASPLSYSSLAGDLQISPNTVKKYIQILESLHIIFLVRPYFKQISRSIRKEPKLYFYDTGFVKGNEGIRLENTIAVCLLKSIEYLTDAKGKEICLNYLRTKDGKEVDFVIIENEEIKSMLEIKLSDNKLSKSLLFFIDLFPGVKAFQLVHNLRQEEHIKGINLVRAGDWLAELDA
jgi:predicted AAA+ superfamily ATPase